MYNFWAGVCQKTFYHLVFSVFLLSRTRKEGASLGKKRRCCIVSASHQPLCFFCSTIATSEESCWHTQQHTIFIFPSFCTKSIIGILWMSVILRSKLLWGKHGWLKVINWSIRNDGCGLSSRDVWGMRIRLTLGRLLCFLQIGAPSRQQFCVMHLHLRGYNCT